jgi:hypothetical protein
MKAPQVTFPYRRRVKEGWNEAKAIIDLSAGQITEQSPGFIAVMERQCCCEQT